MGAVSSTTVDRDDGKEPQKELSAPVASIPEQRAPMLGPKPKSFDLGGSKPCLGLAMVRAASAPHGGLSATTVSGLRRAANFRAAASLKGARVPLAFAFPTRTTASKAIDKTNNTSAGDAVKRFSNGPQAINSLATSSKSAEQHTSAATEHSTASEILAATTAADSGSPHVVTSVLLTDPFASRASEAANNAPENPAISQNAFTQDPSQRGASSTTNPFASRASKAANNAPKNLAIPQNAFTQYPSKRGASSTTNPLDEPLGKRQRIEAQPVITTPAPCTSAPPSRKRFLWSIPAYDPAKDPTSLTAPTTEPAAVSTNTPPPAPRPAFARLIESAKDQWKNVPNAKKNEATKAPVAPNASPKKPKLPPTANLLLPRNGPATQASPFNVPHDAPGAPPLPTIKITPPTPTSAVFPPSAAPPRTKSKPWTSREYAELAQVAYHSFPFAVFAATHGKTEAEVMKTYSAIIQLPIFNHSAKGLARARVKEWERAEEEVREVHRAEERQGGGSGVGKRNGRKRAVGERAEDEIALMRLRKGEAGKGAGRG